MCVSRRVNGRCVCYGEASIQHNAVVIQTVTAEDTISHNDVLKDEMTRDNQVLQDWFTIHLHFGQIGKKKDPFELGKNCLLLYLKISWLLYLKISKKLNPLMVEKQGTVSHYCLRHVKNQPED